MCVSTIFTLLLLPTLLQMNATRKFPTTRSVEVGQLATNEKLKDEY